VAATVVGGAAVVGGAVVGGTVVGGTVVGAAVGGVVVGGSVVAGAEVEVDDVEVVDEVLDVAGLFEWLLRPIRKAPTAMMMATTTTMPMTRARSTGSRPPLPAASGSTGTCEPAAPAAPAAAAGAGTYARVADGSVVGTCWVTPGSVGG
jgi:hypothetical protein